MGILNIVYLIEKNHMTWDYKPLYYSPSNKLTQAHTHKDSFLLVAPPDSEVDQGPFS